MRRMRATKTLKSLRSFKTPFVFQTVWSVLLFSVAAFTLFVVWQWLSQPAFDPESRFPLDPHSRGNIVAHSDNAKQDGVPVVKEASRCCNCEKQQLRANEKAGLLHNWNDTDLRARVIAAELWNDSLTSTEVDCSGVGSKDTSSGSNGIYRLPSGSPKSCSSFCAGKSLESLKRGQVKIAFLFMITSFLPFEPLWNEFFEGHEGLYSIYIHTDPFDADLFNKSSPFFWKRSIPSSKAFRGSPSLVAASNRLVANAMLDDPRNEYFILLSGSCIPVRNFNYVYNTITASTQSFIEQIRNESVMWERYTGRGGAEIMLPEITWDQFRKAAQWFVFTRRHALLILQDVQEKKYWGKFDHECKIYFCGTDEHYYPTILQILDPDGVTGTTVTYVHWPKWVTEHPSTFYRYQINKDLITDIQRENDGQYLFARKFEVDTVDLLMNLTNIILT